LQYNARADWAEICDALIPNDETKLEHEILIDAEHALEEGPHYSYKSHQGAQCKVHRSTCSITLRAMHGKPMIVSRSSI